MKRIVFLGAPDKSHLLLVLGKLLSAMELKVLLVDSTLTQGIQSYLPDSDYRSPVREFEGIDIASGFITLDQLERHLRQQIAAWDYDVLLLDTDHTEFVKGRDLPVYDRRVWCSSFGRLHLQRNADLMKRLCLHEADGKPLSFYKMLTSLVPVSVTEAYLDELLPSHHFQWEDAVFRFTLDERDASVELDNQHHGRLDVRRLTGNYRRNVLNMVKQLLEWDEKNSAAGMEAAEKGTNQGKTLTAHKQ